VAKSGKYRMTRKLEELFNISSDHGDIDSSDDQSGDDIEKNLPILPETLAAIDKIEQALPAVRGLEASDSEMDSLATKATESFDNLMDLGMQVDSRYASEIFAVASQMLGHAITAKTAKMNKKLKMIDLQLKKARLDQVEAGGTALPNAEGRVLDRNELLKHLTQLGAEKSNNGK
jgi:vancomycin resistance protein YoaR